MNEKQFEFELHPFGENLKIETINVSNKRDKFITKLENEYSQNLMDIQLSMSNLEKYEDELEEIKEKIRRCNRTIDRCEGDNAVIEIIKEDIKKYDIKEVHLIELIETLYDCYIEKEDCDYEIS